jgi:Cof subfamily protein (haloacid dehalogenase superfamily)
MNKISLVISDVDGTLVTSDKVLTERSREAVARLDAQGIAFTIASSRPAFGLRMLSEQLRLQLPMGAYNGGALVAPDLTIIEQRLVTPEVARKALTVFQSFGIDVWIFTADSWLARDPCGAYVEKEKRSIQALPKIVAHLDDHLDGVAKIVGVSADSERLTHCEAEVRRTIMDGASIARSQPYYLDITPAGTNKGVIVDALIQRLGIPSAEIASIGDMDNDISMFAKSGFRIAMGNASPDVMKAADAVTRSNNEDGFADAIERLILPRADGASISGARHTAGKNDWNLR